MIHDALKQRYFLEVHKKKGVARPRLTSGHGMRTSSAATVGSGRPNTKEEPYSYMKSASS